MDVRLDIVYYVYLIIWLMKKLTPAQQQYADLKAQHTDALLFFRMWDFYELFHDDAIRAHTILWITLTARDKSSDNPIPMAWIPYHSLDKYTPKLLAAWFKIAIAEQVWKVEKWKIVRREVTQVLTPGTIVWDTHEFNYIMSVCFTDTYTVAWGDISLGTYYTAVCSNLSKVIKHIEHIHPAEVVVDISFPELDAITESISSHDIVSAVFEVPHQPKQFLQQQLWVQSLLGYWQALTWWKPSSLALLFSYVENMQQRKVQPIHSIWILAKENYVLFDDITRDNLEVFSSRYSSSRKHSLYDVINNTSTPMWSRLLYHRLANPISDKWLLEMRLSYVRTYLDDTVTRNKVRAYLDQVSDMHRLVTRIVSRSPSSLSLQNLLFLLRGLYASPSSTLIQDELSIVWCSDSSYELLRSTYQLLEKWITLEPIETDTISILPGYDTDIDKYKQLVQDADSIFLEYQQDLVTHASWIKVKLKWIKNQWYLLEVTPKDIENFESYRIEWDNKYNFIRTQTLKTGQRYVTPFLQKIALQIEEAKELLYVREQELLAWFVDIVEHSIHACIDVSNGLACLDVAVSCSLLMEQKDRCIPEFQEWKHIDIRSGRHPVVEQFLPTHESFIPNDLSISEDEYIHLITWPNMWWKSTYLRQQSLILLLAHAWLPVPAASAKLPIIDALFARIGAGDALAKNQSTFMTEMLETANIIHNATDRSFVILDELWRWTSTYDWMSLVKAIIVYLCQQKRATTLFATHYHELTSLEEDFPCMKNYHVSVYESQHDVVFLKKVVAGKANKSYWLDVARLAWVPDQIISCAWAYLEELERTKKWSVSQLPHQAGFEFWPIVDKYHLVYDEIQELLAHKHIHEITPIESLLLLKKINDLFAS